MTSPDVDESPIEPDDSMEAGALADEGLGIGSPAAEPTPQGARRSARIRKPIERLAYATEMEMVDNTNGHIT